MAILLIPKPAAISKDEMDQLGPVKVPLSWPPSVLTGQKYIDESPGIDSMGIWECSPGRWQRTIMQEEFAHFLAGSARFIPADGEPIDIRAGDSIWFPANSAGIWEIHETARKVYVIIDRPTLFSRVKSALKTNFRRWLGLAARAAVSSHEAPVPVSEPKAVWRAAEGQLQRHRSSAL